MDLKQSGTWMEMPVPGSKIYVGQVSPARAFVGEVILIWLNENDRWVICVKDEDGDLINLGPDDQWVPYFPPHGPVPVDIEILRTTHYCPCCDAPLLESRSGQLDHPWLWS